MKINLNLYKKIFVDTAPFIYFYEEHKEFGDISKEIFTFHKNQKQIFVTSALTVMEVLPKPISENDSDLIKKYINAIKNNPLIDLTEINYDIAFKAAELRANYKFLKGIDSLQISSAIESNCDCFITNDERLKNISNIKILSLTDLI
ncbi:MAG: PIN domain-containing protein [Leptospiraceae bacterium]|nr:PIN domain-containing protein [Leptospiraceae bacterium]